MPRATLSEVLQPALEGHYAVAGLVCLGWEDARAYVEAAEAEGAPVILQAGPGARANMPIAVWGAMFTALAEGASVPVVSHLDHGASEDEVRQAIEAGFTSVMFDGSRLALAENIAQTARMVAMAHTSGVSCEGEIGFVGYQDGAASTGTDPAEAAQFVAETGVDAVAISAGNVHLQETPGTGLDEARIAAIEAQVRTPLVIHGGSGLGQDARRRYARDTRIAKFNIGTELRMAFGTALRAALSDDPKIYDRIAILKATHDPLVAAARRVISGLKAP